MPEGMDYAYGAGPGGGLGNKIGEIGSPLNSPPYSIEPGGGNGQKGGENQGPFAQHMQTPGTLLPIVGRDGLQGAPQGGFGNVGSGGGIVTPMDNPSAAMPGVTGSSGTGPSGGGKISSPFSSPWGDSVG